MYKANAETAAGNDRTPDAELAARLERVKTVRYIKLGQGGAWASEAIEQGVLPLGFREVAHAPCAAGDWATVGAQLEQAGRTPGGVSHGIRELKDFYGLGEDCVWMTFANGHLYWAIAEEKVSPLAQNGDTKPTKMRRTIGGWQRNSLGSGPIKACQ